MRSRSAISRALSPCSCNRLLMAVVLIALAIAGGMQLGKRKQFAPEHVPNFNPVSVQPASKVAPAISTSSTGFLSSPSVDHLPSPRGLDMSKLSAQDLLTQFLVSRDSRLLKAAQERFPEDPKVILQSCLEATDPNSPFLVKLEKLDPQNALPNLIRASLLAKTNEISDFSDQVNAALSKSSLKTNARERLADVMNYVLANPNGPNALEMLDGFDSNYLLSIRTVALEYIENWPKFGDDLTTAAKGLALASLFRKASTTSLSYDVVSENLELALLRKLPPNTEYGDTGITVEQRMKDVKNTAIYHMDLSQKYVKPLFASGADPALQLQFFTRIRADGEKAAVNWLINRQKPVRR